MRIRSILAGLVLTLLAAAPAHAQDGTTLYQRMGGYDRVAAVVDDFMGRFDADPLLAPFLGGINAPAGARIRQHFVDFICARAGGPCLYNGRSMPDTHAGLAIEPRHFDAVMRHFSEALDAQAVGAGEKRELLTMLEALRPEIVTGG